MCVREIESKKEEGRESVEHYVLYYVSVNMCKMSWKNEICFDIVVSVLGKRVSNRKI